MNRRRFIKAGLAAGAVSGALYLPLTSAASQAAPPLKFLTWNVWLMPPPISPRNNARAAAIAQELLRLDYDVLCFEKVLDPTAGEVLTQALAHRYTYTYGPANSGPSLRLTSGVMIVSRLPLRDMRQIEFRDHAGIDSFARKGAMLLDGQFGSTPFQVLATHLQGDTRPEDDNQNIRDRQIAQIAGELLTRYATPGTPMFLCGDFHTSRFGKDGVPSASYAQMLAAFGAVNGEQVRITSDDDKTRNTLAIDDTKLAQELDYILVRPNGANISTHWRRHVFKNCHWDGGCGRDDLSYRYAVGLRADFMEASA